MTTFERIQKLAEKRDKNLKEVSLELGYSKNYLYTLKTKEPSADKLRNIADYFHVSTDYLLERTDNPNTDTQEDSITTLFRINTANMDPEQKDEIEEELKLYTEFLIQKALDKKRRRRNNK